MRPLTLAGRVWRSLWPLVVSLLVAAQAFAAQTGPASHIASLIDPSKLATLNERGANPRVQKAVYWLAVAREHGEKPVKILDRAIASAGYKGAAARLTKAALLRNLDIAEKLGCLDAPGLAEMRRGVAATVRKGPYKGDPLSVDHIIPIAVVPELDKVIANLELMPLRMNEGKNDKVASRQLALGKQLHKAGLLSKQGWRTLKKADKNVRAPTKVMRSSGGRAAFCC